MDPISLFSIFIKITSLDLNKNKNINEKDLNKTSRTEIIDLYRSTMTKNNKYDSKFN